MGTVGKKIANLDIEELISLLNIALADEWLAYYQCRVGAKVIKGRMSGTIKAELIEHAEDEFRHANMLVERIQQLGGAPIIDFKELLVQSPCGYAAPTDPKGEAILTQNIKGEQCAIGAYQKILKLTEGKDAITYHMIFEILKDEIEHEDDLENILEDLNS